MYSQCIYLYFKLVDKRIGDYQSLANFKRIGFIDQDGLIHVPEKYHNYFNTNDLFIKGEFLYRQKFLLNVIYADNRIYLEKIYGKRYNQFINELVILHELRNIDFIPKIQYIDYKNRSIIINYINGYVLREKLAKCGALIRDIDKKRLAENNFIAEEYMYLSLVLRSVVNKDLFNQIQKSYAIVHDMKILVNDIKFGNILINDNNVSLVDFADSMHYKNTPKFIFNILKQSDIQKLKNIFKSTELST